MKISRELQSAVNQYKRGFYKINCHLCATLNQYYDHDLTKRFNAGTHDWKYYLTCKKCDGDILIVGDGHPFYSGSHPASENYQKHIDHVENYLKTKDKNIDWDEVSNQFNNCIDNIEKHPIDISPDSIEVAEIEIPDEQAKHDVRNRKYKESLVDVYISPAIGYELYDLTIDLVNDSDNFIKLTRISRPELEDLTRILVKIMSNYPFEEESHDK